MRWAGVLCLCGLALVVGGQDEVDVLSVEQDSAGIPSIRAYKEKVRAAHQAQVMDGHLGVGVTTLLEETAAPLVVGEEGEVVPTLVNFASQAAGATILAKNAEAKGTKHLLTEDDDKYSMSSCKDAKFVVVGLSEDCIVQRITLANLERYSSGVKDFLVLGSQTYPTKEWMVLGNFTAADNAESQAFDMQVGGVWARYIKLVWKSHYRDEYYCTMTRLQVHGHTMMQDLHHAVAEPVVPPPPTPEPVPVPALPPVAACNSSAQLCEGRHVGWWSDSCPDNAVCESAKVAAQPTPSHTPPQLQCDSLTCQQYAAIMHQQTVRWFEGQGERRVVQPTAVPVPVPEPQPSPPPLPSPTPHPVAHTQLPRSTPAPRHKHWFAAVGEWSSQQGRGNSTAPSPAAAGATNTEVKPAANSTVAASTATALEVVATNATSNSSLPDMNVTVPVGGVPLMPPPPATGKGSPAQALFKQLRSQVHDLSLQQHALDVYLDDFRAAYDKVILSLQGRLESLGAGLKRIGAAANTTQSVTTALEADVQALKAEAGQGGPLSVAVKTDGREETCPSLPPLPPSRFERWLPGVSEMDILLVAAGIAVVSSLLALVLSLVAVCVACRREGRAGDAPPKPVGGAQSVRSLGQDS